MARPGFVAYLFVVQCTTAVLCRCFYIRFVLPLIDEAHNFIVVVEDNFSNSYELEFDFNNRNVKDDDLTIVPIGNFSPLLK